MNPAKRGPIGSYNAESRKPRQPTLRKVTRDDLYVPIRNEGLFRDAVRLGLVVGTPAGRLCVFGAIEHAKAHGTKNVCGLFAWIVRNGRWNHINQQDEDRAHSTIRMLREGGVAHGKERAIRVQADNGSVLGGVPWRAPETARQILAGTGAEAYPILAAVSAALRQRRA